MASIIRAEEHNDNSIRRFDLESLGLEPGREKEDHDTREKILKEILSQAEKIKRERMAEAERKAQEILKRAEDESEEIIHQAQKQAQDLMKSAREEGFKAGFDEGFNKGMQQAEQKLKAMEETLRQAVDELHRLTEEMIKQNEKEILQLIRMTAEKIALKELSISPESLLKVAREAIRIPRSPQAVLKLPPDLLSLFREHRSKLMEDLDGVESIRIEPDESLGRFDLIVETDDMIVDATISRRAGEIQRVIEEVYRAHEPQA